MIPEKTYIALLIILTVGAIFSLSNNNQKNEEDE